MGRRDVLGAVGVGKEPLVADAVEALGQHVQQKAADDLVRVKPHRLPAARTGHPSWPIPFQRRVPATGVSLLRLRGGALAAPACRRGP